MKKYLRITILLFFLFNYAYAGNTEKEKIIINPCIEEVETQETEQQKAVEIIDLMDLNISDSPPCNCKKEKTKEKENKENTNSILNVYKNDNIKFKNFNLLDLKTISYKDNLGNNSRLYGLTIDTYNDIDFRDSIFSINTNLNYSHLNKPVYNSTKLDKVEIENQLTLSEFRLKIQPDKHFILTVGILPLYRGMSYKYDTFDFNRNDGSYYVSGLILQGAEILYKDYKNNFYITVGKGYYEKYDINNIELHNKKVKGSDGSYIFGKKKQYVGDYIIEHNFESSEVNYRHDDILSFEQHIYGYNLAVNNESHLLWGFIGYEKGHGDNTALVRKTLNIPSYIPDNYIQQNTQTTFIGPYEVEGYSRAIGYRYFFDFNKKENFFLIENYKTYKNWVVPNYGEPFSEYGLGRLGTQNKFVYGYYINPNFLIKGTYFDMKYDKAYKEGGSLLQTDISNFPNLKTKEQSLMFTIQYLF